MTPVYEFGGDGPTVHLALANGFPPQTYHPLVDPLTGRYRVLCLPPRALWPDETPPDQRLNWKQTLAKDLIEGIRQHDLTNIIAIGHSFGSVATLLACIAMPARFRAVILLDPTILPRFAMRWMQLAQWLNRDLGNKLAQRADRRRDHFESRQDAYDALRTKGLFRAWDEAAFQGYIDALTDDPLRGGVTLAWPRAWEAYYFRTLYAGTWGELPKLRGLVPLMVVRGGQSDTFLPEALERFKRILPTARAEVIDGHGHLFPHTAPAETRAVIESFLADVIKA
jgi:pimeloyl-ACP methyl ester carboxylesterase